LSSNIEPRSNGIQQSQPRLESRKRDVTDSSGAKSSQKRRKSIPDGTSGVGSCGSALTIIGVAFSEACNNPKKLLDKPQIVLSFLLEAREVGGN